MTSKICLIIVHGFMNAAIKNYGYDQWSFTINVHSYIYEHQSCMINDYRYRYEHWSPMIIDHEHNYSWSMIVAMKCCWSYMISVDQWVISWPLHSGCHKRLEWHGKSYRTFWLRFGTVGSVSVRGVSQILAQERPKRANIVQKWPKMTKIWLWALWWSQTVGMAWNELQDILVEVLTQLGVCLCGRCPIFWPEAPKMA